MEDFHRIRRLPPYVFEQVNRAKAIARNAGRRHHRPRHGQSRPAGARACHREAEGHHRAAAHRPLFVVARHPRAAPRPGRLLRAPLRREAQSRDPDRHHARLQGRLRQRGAGDHRARRRRAGAGPELSDPCLRLPDGGRRVPLGAVGADARLLLDARARDRAFDPEAARGRGLLSVEPDRLCRRSRLLQGAGAVREEARHLHPLRSRLCRGLFRQQSAAVGAAGAGRDGHRGRVHLDVEDLFDAGLAHRLRGRQRAHHRRARRA